LVYKIQTAEKYGYKQFLEIVERELEKEAALKEAQVTQLERMPQLKVTPRPTEEKRKKTIKGPGSQKKIKSERRGTKYMNYMESESEDEDENDD
jgi:hypothetical protein